MVERVTGNENSILQHTLAGQQTEQAERVEEVNKHAAKPQKTAEASVLFGDQADVSSAAKKLYEGEKFGKLANKIQLPENNKVAHLKELYQSGKTKNILELYANEDLAQSLLDSPAGAFLR